MFARASHQRLLRGVAAAGFTSYAALASHVLASGPSPNVLGMIVTLLLSAFVRVALAGRRLSLWRLTASVTASQAMFHWMFSATSHGDAASHDTAPSSPSAHAAMHSHHHLEPGALQLPTIEASGHAHASGAMMASHIVAAAATIVVIHWRQTILAHLRMLTRLLWTLLLPALRVVLLVPATRTSALPGPPSQVHPQQVPLTSIPRRGPPALRL